ncbi:2,3-bisphosphoglycerate-independent phosphoglycerate mutase [bacterium]|nr:2,3-bisphosphoglycerate-independent phosphoglycerate mutase [bacterium]
MYEEILPQLINTNNTKLVLLVLDGLGGTTNADGVTELEVARTPNMDALISSGSAGLHRPVGYGITPGSGPGHLGLFGYNPIKYQIGRGILEAFGVDMEVNPGDLAMRGNFCTMENGIITDRRAGRISTDKCKELVEKLKNKIQQIEDIKIDIKAGREYRFAVVLRGDALSAMISDADPQTIGKRPIKAMPLSPIAEKTARIVNKFIEMATEILAEEYPANTVLLRGYSKLADIKTSTEKYGMRAVCIAVYPMYRGLAKIVGMDTPQLPGETTEDEFETVKKVWNDYDFFFVHIKKTDSYGEDGNFDGKVRKIEEVDEKLPMLLDLKPDVIAITGDHCTPSVHKSHSWHPVPLLLKGKYTFADDAKTFSERECAKGIIGHIPAEAIILLMMADAGKLKKFGA